MRILPEICEDVKNGIAPDGEGRATVETDLSVPSARQGEYRSFLCPDGSKALNFGGEGEAEGVEPPSPDLSVDLINIYANCHTLENIEIVDCYREHCCKLECSPCTFLYLRHKKDGSTVLYRVNACSSSRYFQQGRAQMIKNIHQRLNGKQERGVFFTLTVDTKRYDLAGAWSSMWLEYNRFKKSLNIYRKRYMNAEHGILYLAALEPHESDYPHLHVYCPGLRWLIKRQDLGKMDNWWGMGSANTEKELRSDSAESYITKYISKMDGWSELSLAMIWHFRIRIYNLSHQYYTGETEGEWELLDRFRDASDLAEGIGIGFRQAEALIEAFADMDKNLVHLTSPSEGLKDSGTK